MVTHWSLRAPTLIVSVPWWPSYNLLILSYLALLHAAPSSPHCPPFHSSPPNAASIPPLAEVSGWLDPWRPLLSSLPFQSSSNSLGTSRNLGIPTSSLICAGPEGGAPLLQARPAHPLQLCKLWIGHPTTGKDNLVSFRMLHIEMLFSQMDFSMSLLRDPKGGAICFPPPHRHSCHTHVREERQLHQIWLLVSPREMLL